MRPGGKKAERENKLHAHRTQADSQPKLIPYSHKCTLAQQILTTSTSDSYQFTCIDDTKAKRSYTLNLYIDCKQVLVIAKHDYEATTVFWLTLKSIS